MIKGDPSVQEVTKGNEADYHKQYPEGNLVAITIHVAQNGYVITREHDAYRNNKMIIASTIYECSNRISELLANAKRDQTS